MDKAHRSNRIRYKRNVFHGNYFKRTHDKGKMLNSGALNNLYAQRSFNPKNLSCRV